MKVQCPDCQAAIPAANFSLESGWAKCEACHELFDLADVVPGFVPTPSQPGEKERPAGSRTLLERSDGELFIHVPAEGFRGATIGALAFSMFWLGFISFWTLAALGGFGGRAIGPVNWAFASFSVPFWMAGLWMLSAIIWSLWGKKSIRIDRNGMRTFQRCLLWSRAKWIERERLLQARRYLGRRQSTMGPSSALEIAYDAGSFVLSVDSRDEADWLIGEINGFIKSLI